MDNVFDMKDFIGTSAGDKDHMLGKFLYFSLSSLLVEKEALAKLCEETGIPYTGGKRMPVADAFRSATGDIRERYPVTTGARPTSAWPTAGTTSTQRISSPGNW